MAGGIYSNWKITLDPGGTPLVLVNYLDRLESEIDLSAQRPVSVIPLVNAAAPLLQDGKNVSVTLAFARYDDSDTDANARKALMQSILTALAAESKILKIEVSGITDRYWQFASALVTAFRPVRYRDAPVARRLTSYQIVATGLTEVAVP